MQTRTKNQNRKMLAGIAAVSVLLLLAPQLLIAQDIGGGIDQAASQVKGIFANVSNLVLMIGGVVGLISGVVVFIEWNNGGDHVNKKLIAWGGSCVFLLLTGGVLKAFFGM
jgi:hypothetical protein